MKVSDIIRFPEAALATMSNAMRPHVLPLDFQDGKRVPRTLSAYILELYRNEKEMHFDWNLYASIYSSATTSVCRPSKLSTGMC